MRILQQLSEIYFIDFSVRFRLPNTQAFHQPAVLLRCDTECFVLVARPLEPAFFKAFVEKQEAVAFPVECLDSVCSSAAKQEQRICTGIKLKLLLHNGRQTINAASQVRVAAGEIHLFRSAKVVQHDFSA